MQVNPGWRELGWRHPVWDMLRFYSVVRAQGKKIAAEWRRKFESSHFLEVDSNNGFAVDPKDVGLFWKYLDDQEADFATASACLRSEAEAIGFAESVKAAIRVIATQSADHHQSSAATVAAVSFLAEKVCKLKGLTCDTSPQRRCVWLLKNSLHVTARNLDGAAPALLSPKAIWEIKEYWGKTKGGSKMSDAVYECQLVGRELREFEGRGHPPVAHIVFVDGRDQWNHRKSDLRRFIDLFHQGIIDYLFIGREVETEWEPLLASVL
ncbi:hypothetical protein BH10PLA2_BH10PLA2_00970 [soil metagenome]